MLAGLFSSETRGILCWLVHLYFGSVGVAYCKSVNSTVGVWPGYEIVCLSSPTLQSESHTEDARPLYAAATRLIQKRPRQLQG